MILPCYNGENFIREAIESVLCQTYEDFEVIVIDDGSTDNTRTVASSFEDRRIRYFYKKNEGVSTSRNYGIKLAKGRYIAFIDYDDLWLPEKLELQLQEIEKQQDVYLVYSWFYIIDSKGKIIDKIKVQGFRNFLQELLLVGNIIGSPSGMLIKKEVFENIGGFDSYLSTSADWDLWIRIAYRYKLSGVNKFLFKYRIHDTNMHCDIITQEHDTKRILNKFFSNASLEDRYNKIKNLAFSNAYMLIAKSYFKKRKYQNFLKTLTLSFFCYPVNLLKAFKTEFFKFLRIFYKYFLKYRAICKD